ncbi:hypothetical protein Acr_02g0008600 [Actinidia rufa]|uniref:Uncharacterized protein n=1 Tax=Actinidia rufa TaxID=165716 RepID=A0A7J0E894_9ERIC|nr:hypothetical protein Acr_02g0008600 [Actinidia rufa]
MPKIYCCRPTIALLPMTTTLAPTIAFLLQTCRDPLPIPLVASSLGLSSSLGELEKSKEVKRGYLQVLVLLEAFTLVLVAGVLVVNSSSEVVSDLSFPPQSSSHATCAEPLEGYGQQDRICKHSSKLKKAQKKAQMYESDLKKMKDALAAETNKWEANDNLTARLQPTKDYYTRLGAELRPGIFQEASLEVEYLNPPEPYSPILLLDFNEEEYANHPAEYGA